MHCIALIVVIEDDQGNGYVNFVQKPLVDGMLNVSYCWYLTDLATLLSNSSVTPFTAIVTALLGPRTVSRVFAYPCKIPHFAT